VRELVVATSWYSTRSTDFRRSQRVVVGDATDYRMNAGIDAGPTDRSAPELDRRADQSAVAVLVVPVAVLPALSSAHSR
jgi:hypothetical protein